MKKQMLVSATWVLAWFAVFSFQTAATAQQMPKASTTILTDAEKNHVLWMREESKVARDLYTFLFNRWGIPVFKKKMVKEQVNMDRSLTIINKYGLTDPIVKDEQGIYSKENFRQMYVELAMRGNSSLPEALRAAAITEELDIMELEDALQNTITNPDLKSIYNTMAVSSRNHLRAIIEQIQCMGEIYGPQRLPEKRFYSIVDSPVEPETVENK